MRHASAAATPSAASDGCGTRLEPQQAREHELHLLLRRAAGADDRLLDLGGRELVDDDARLLAGEQDHAARMAEHDGRAHVLA